MEQKELPINNKPRRLVSFGQAFLIFIASFIGIFIGWAFTLGIGIGVGSNPDANPNHPVTVIIVYTPLFLGALLPYFVTFIIARLSGQISPHISGLAATLGVLPFYLLMSPLIKEADFILYFFLLILILWYGAAAWVGAHKGRSK